MVHALKASSACCALAGWWRRATTGVRRDRECMPSMLWLGPPQLVAWALPSAGVDLLPAAEACLLPLPPAVRACCVGCPTLARTLGSDALRRFKEGTLSIGENSCLDRCCSKYWQVCV